MAAVNWSNLPDLALYLISELLTFSVDHIRFRSVCKSWRSATPKPSQLPWLVGFHCYQKPHKGTAKIFRPCAFAKVHFKLFSLPSSSSGRYLDHRILPIEEVHVPDLFPYGYKYYGSSNGYMMFSDDSMPLLFYNPVTKFKICFPPAPTSPSLSSFQNIFVPHSSYSIVLAVLVTKTDMHLAFCGYGNKTWTLIPSTLLLTHSIHAVFHRGQFYVLHGRSEIYVCSIGPTPELSENPIANLDELDLLEFIHGSYLVESPSGDLLLVFREILQPNSDQFVNYFKIFKVDWAQSPVKLVKLTSLDDYALFLDEYSAFSLSSTRTGCRRNCIYFMDCKYVRVFNLEDGSTEKIPYPDRRVNSWIAPNLLS